MHLRGSWARGNLTSMTLPRMMLLDFMEFVEAEPKLHYNCKTKEFEPTDKKKVSKAASSLMVMKLQHIYNAAKGKI